jgi:type VI protein secretion system component VasF
VPEDDKRSPEEAQLPEWAERTIERLVAWSVIGGVVAVVVLALIGLVVVVRALL